VILHFNPRITRDNVGNDCIVPFSGCIVPFSGCKVSCIEFLCCGISVFVSVFVAMFMCGTMFVHGAMQSHPTFWITIIAWIWFGIIIYESIRMFSRTWFLISSFTIFHISERITSSFCISPKKHSLPLVHIVTK